MRHNRWYTKFSARSSLAVYLHRVGLSGARLSVREDTDIVAVESALHQLRHLSEHLRLWGRCAHEAWIKKVGRSVFKWLVLVKSSRSEKYSQTKPHLLRLHPKCFVELKLLHRRIASRDDLSHTNNQYVRYMQVHESIF